MTKHLDLRLYALLDPSLSPRHHLPALCDVLITNGVTLVQVRDKHGTAREQIALARALVSAARRRVPVLVNDRVDVALASGADGVHLGQEDMDAADARRLLGPEAIIGLTVKNESHARSVPVAAVNYVCVGGVFVTSSKQNPDAPVGLGGLAALLDVLHRLAPGLPAGAIAGITEANAAQVIGAGADGVAVISALTAAADPAAATRRLRAIVDDALALRGSSR